MLDFFEGLDISDAASVTFANAMKKMAEADGEVHPAEQEMIDAFLKEAASEKPDLNEDLSTLDTPEVKKAFLRTLALVAMVDGEKKSQEVDLMNDYVSKLGHPQSAEMVFEEVGKGILSKFKGVVAFRDQAEEIGRSFGLSESAISEVLD